jgi:RNA polymerase sigma-70 factor (ECF subfamily)
VKGDDWLAEAGQQKGVEGKKTDGRQEALTPEMLVRKYSSAVLSLCIAHTKNFHDSEDIMQEVFLRAMTKLKTLRDEDRARPWLLTIARRLCADYYRQRRPQKTVNEDVAARANCFNEHIARVHEAITELPEQYREPIALYYLDGRNCAGVARTLGISEQAVRQRLVRARLMLHKLLSEDKL